MPKVLESLNHAACGLIASTLEPGPYGISSRGGSRTALSTLAVPSQRF